MWLYKVIHSFKDLQDSEHIYKVGDIYPRQGVQADKERIERIKSASR